MGEIPLRLTSQIDDKESKRVKALGLLLVVILLSGCLPSGNGFGPTGTVKGAPTPTPTPAPIVKAATLEYVSGASQTAKVNELYATPIAFRIYGEDNQPLAGATFHILDQESSVSDSDGLASITLRAATVTGFPVEYPVDLIVDGTPVDTQTVNLTTAAGAPKELEIFQDIVDGDTISIGDVYNMVFIVKDEYGNHADYQEGEDAVEIDLYSDANCTTPSDVLFQDAQLNQTVVDGGAEVYQEIVFMPGTDGPLHIGVRITGEDAEICSALLNVIP